MPSPISIGTRDIPLKLAETISKKANESWESGEMLSRVSLVTQDLLKFWFKEPHTQTRHINFHEGQKQAILNAVYLHEVLKTKFDVPIIIRLAKLKVDSMCAYLLFSSNSCYNKFRKMRHI